MENVHHHIRVVGAKAPALRYRAAPGDQDLETMARIGFQDRAAVAALCRRHAIRRLSSCGSASKGTNRPDGVDVPDFSRCGTAGETLENARRTAAEALQFHIEGMIEDGASTSAPSRLDRTMADAATAMRSRCLSL